VKNRNKQVSRHPPHGGDLISARRDEPFGWVCPPDDTLTGTGEPSGYFAKPAQADLAAFGGFVGVALTFMSGRAWFHLHPALSALSRWERSMRLCYN